MLTDYKFWYIKRDDNGFITEAAIRFYEGDVVTETRRMGVPPILTQITHYKRFKKLQGDELKHLRSNKIKKDINDQDSVVYTPEHFGPIKTDDELRMFLNDELVKDILRLPIREQKNG